MWQVCRGLFRRREMARARRWRRGPSRLGLDWLEARTLLSNVTWTGAADGKSWAVAGNWSGDAVPGSSDDVTINLGGNPTIQITHGVAIGPVVDEQRSDRDQRRIAVGRGELDDERRPGDDRRVADGERLRGRRHRHGDDDGQRREPLRPERSEPQSRPVDRLHRQRQHHHARGHRRGQHAEPRQPGERHRDRQQLPGQPPNSRPSPAAR